MIKVLHVFAALNTGGVESFVMNLQKALSRDDIRFDFLLRSRRNDTEKIKYFKKNGSRIYITADWPRHIMLNSIQMKKFFLEHGQEYDFIHIHANALIYMLPVLLAHRYSAAGIILHSHNTRTKEAWMQYVHYLNRMKTGRYEIIRLACSKEAGRWMFANGFRVIPNGIDADRFQTSDEDLRRKDSGIFIMVSAGRLAKQKNYSFLFPVIKRLLKEGIQLHYYIAGEGELRTVLEQQIQKDGLEGYVTLLGKVKRVEMLLKKAHVFLMPSLYEGFSVALVEAQSSGIPCVVSDCIAPESVLCENVCRTALEHAKWADEIKKIATDRNYKFCSKNHAMVKSSLYGLDGLKQAMKKIYVTENNWKHRKGDMAVGEKEPLVSVVLPVYNRPGVKKTIESIINQTYQNLELIIIDNASEDNTADVIRGIQDSRIRLVLNNKNMGQTFSMNRGLALANGKYIARIDSDDIALPERIAKQVCYMEQHPECVLCGSWVQVINDNDEKLYVLKSCKTDKGIRVSHIYRCAFWHPSVMMRSDVLKKEKLLYDEKLMISEDYDMWCRLMQHGRGHNIGEVLTYYRRGSQNDSKKYLDVMWRESQIIKRREREKLKHAAWRKKLLRELEIENKDTFSILDAIKVYRTCIRYIHACYKQKDSDFKILKYYLYVEVFGMLTYKNDGLSGSVFMMLYRKIKHILEGFMRYGKQKMDLH